MGTHREITVLLHGGLGNQLFQYAAAVGLALTDPDSNSRVSVYSYGSEWGPDHPDLNRLIGEPIRYPDRLARTTIPGIAAHEDWKDPISAWIARGLGRMRSVQVITQDDPYSPPGHVRTGNVVLDGFFQQRDWWLGSWPTVAARIASRAPDAFDELRKERRTVVKLRRSDYVGRGIVLTDDYYRAALARLGVKNCEVTVVCEDPLALDDAKRLLDEVGCRMRLPEPITGDANLDDFWHLAAAHTHILANSSYCWWSAAVAFAGDASTQVGYPDPWLPNAWGTTRLPDMGVPGWRAVPAAFA